MTVDQMKKKGNNRSMQDETSYKAAVQIVAKNPDIVKQMSSSGGGGSPQAQSQQ